MKTAESCNQTHLRLPGNWYGTGSGSDLAPRGVSAPRGPGRYRFLYRTGAYPKVDCSDLVGFYIRRLLNLLLAAFVVKRKLSSYIPDC
jgi:hypothetical protein